MLPREQGIAVFDLLTVHELPLQSVIISPITIYLTTGSCHSEFQLLKTLSCFIGDDRHCHVLDLC